MASRRYAAAALLLWLGSCHAFMISSNKRFRRPSFLGATTSEPKANIFHDYDKPILLVGCSGKGRELERLANAFVTDNFENSSPKDLMVGLKDAQDLKWPSVIVADFADLSEDLEATYVDTVRKLYQDEKILSVFINVDSKRGQMDQSASERKATIEEDVFMAYSDFELCVADEGTIEYGDDDDIPNEWEHLEWEISRIIARARLAPAVPGAKEPNTNTAHLTMGENTFFLSLSFPDIKQVEPYVEQMCMDVDAMEYRTDLLDCRDDRFELLYGMQLLRRYCRPSAIRAPALPICGQVIEDAMPIVYTVRTRNQAGTYPDDEAGIAQMFKMLEWGLRGGVEVLDVESAWDKDKTDELLSYSKERHSSQILGSHHVVGKEVPTEEAVRLFQQCALDGRAHGAKVVLSIESQDKDRMAHEAALMASSLAKSSGKPVIPNISLILGDVGSFSRIVNLPYTPVTHESLPVKAAPGQMTANEIMAARIIMKIIQAKKFVILGHNIAYSVSPQMQGSAFAAARIPYQYGRADVETVEEFTDSEFFKSPDFGGCSVTIPHKQAIIPYVDVMSDAAKTIGSVNTLIVRKEPDTEDEVFKRVIYGDNTDWKGIYNPLERKLGGPSQDSNEYALILGGGGTARAAAYAASKLGLKLVYNNRTPSKAEELAKNFGGTVVTTIENDTDAEGKKLVDVIVGGSIKVVISTLPAAAEVVLPEWIIESRPVVFDVNYKPYETKLLAQAEKNGCPLVRGSEMLWEQGVGQFEAWTNRAAPYSVMRAVVLENCLPKEILEEQ